MGKFLAGLVTGGAIIAAFAWLFVLPQARENYRELGYNDGHTSARWEIADKIDQQLGNDALPSEQGDLFYDVKASTVVVVERDGVKTLRTVR